MVLPTLGSRTANEQNRFISPSLQLILVQHTHFALTFTNDLDFQFPASYAHDTQAYTLKTSRSNSKSVDSQKQIGNGRTDGRTLYCDALSKKLNTLLTVRRYTVESVRTNASIAAKRSRLPASSEHIFGSIPAKNRSKYATIYVCCKQRRPSFMEISPRNSVFLCGTQTLA